MQRHVSITQEDHSPLFLLALLNFCMKCKTHLSLRLCFGSAKTIVFLSQSKTPVLVLLSFGYIFCQATVCPWSSFNCKLNFIS